MRISDWSSDVCSSDLYQNSVSSGATTHKAIRSAATLQPRPDTNEKRRRESNSGFSCKNRENADPWVRASVDETRGLVVEANFIHQFAGLLAMLGDLGQWQRINHQRTEAGYDRIKLYTLFDRVLVRSEEHTSELQSLMRI